MIREHKDSITDEEIRSVIDLVYNKYGYDFSDYSQASFKRRIHKVMFKYRLQSIQELHYKLDADELFFNLFLEEITVNVTEMFRDPDFYNVLRTDVIPQLSTYPFIRIWHAGCSTGEEVYSMAILLKEAGLLERSLLYATDINQNVLEKATSLKFPLEMKEIYSENYINSGGGCNFQNYYTLEKNHFVFNEEFRNRIVFSPHNLVLDRSFNEFNLILCRNVLIYFNRDLQNRVITLFSESLSPLGFLALGNKESIDFTSSAKEFEIVDKVQKIWRKKK